jgi:transcriptional regulator
MSFSTAYLTTREISIWDLRRQSKTQAEIGRLLGFTRQASNRAFDVIDTKIEKAFNEAAVSNNLTVESIDLVNGVMEAYSPIHKMQVLVSMSRSNGLRVWYMHEGHCGSCPEEIRCRKFLEAEASERGVELTKKDWELPPTLLALKVFAKHIGGQEVV